MTTIKNFGWQIVAVLAIGVLAFWVASTIRTSYGSAPSGLQVGSSTESVVLVGGGLVNIFTARNYCNSRIINTASSSLKISFGSSTPTISNGYMVATNTSATFDSGIYGCGNWKTTIGGGGASGTVTTVEF